MKFLFLNLAILVFGTCFLNAGILKTHVDKVIFLQGAVGERSIVIRINCYDESPIRYLNYFFEDDKKDHALEGIQVDDMWQFTLAKNNKELLNLVIREQDNGDWEGYWREDAKAKIPIILNPIKLDSASANYNYSLENQLDVYNAYKIGMLKLEQLKIKKHTPVPGITWYTEKQSGITLFRLKQQPNISKYDSVNTALQALQLSYIFEYFQLNPKRTDLKFESEIMFFNSKIISFRVVKTVIYQSGEIAKTQQFFNLDINQGKSVALEAIVWFDRNAINTASNSMMQTYTYRKEVFAPKVFSILKTLYPQRIKSTICDLNTVDTWVLPDYVLTKKGILFSFSNKASCSFLDWAIIPYDELEVYLSKDFELLSS
ncbi:hypothetical protein [Leeuwenhoekiella sp. NPDC079379]|uniref:hypothetical protein n=1 Tax=Leeuwenhoekiella sp. NPDC079379 TaxID=3364122 RepID=UPI0037C9BC7D